MTAPIGSLMIGSSNVDAMKAWYEQAFGVTANEMGAYDFGGVQLFIEPHREVSGPTTDPARVIINLNVDDCRAIGKQVDAAGSTWVRPVEQADFGIIGTVADPDGNYLQIIEWGATPEAHKG